MNVFKKIYSVCMVAAMPLLAAGTASIANANEQSDNTLKVAKSFLKAAGSGDGKTLNELMSDDFVWLGCFWFLGMLMTNYSSFCPSGRSLRAYPLMFPTNMHDGRM